MTDAEQAVLVETDDLTRTYRSGPTALVALDGACCTVRPGDRVAVFGPSGSGKSTLLHLLAGIDTATSGTIRWPALGPRDGLRPRHIGVVLQGPSLLPPLDVLENVALPLLLAGYAREPATVEARTALERVGVIDLAGKLPEELSAGQAQRVAVARVLAAAPPLILADEPTGQLDHTTGAVVIDALLDTAAATGAALMVATHDPAVGDRLFARWTMDHGRLTVPGDVMCQPR